MDDRERVVLFWVDRHASAPYSRASAEALGHQDRSRRSFFGVFRCASSASSSNRADPRLAITTTSSELQIAAIDRMNRAREQLDDSGVFRRNAVRNLVDDGGRRNTQYSAMPPSATITLKAEDVVHFAQSSPAGLAITALAARHDLFGDHAVADLHARNVRPRLRRVPARGREELVPRITGALTHGLGPPLEQSSRPTGLQSLAQKSRTAMLITSSCAPRARLRYLFDAIVFSVRGRQSSPCPCLSDAE